MCSIQRGRWPDAGASPTAFIALVFALSVPFWLIGARTELQLLPGLPVSALQVLCPLLAAVMLVYRGDNGADVTALLKWAIDFDRIRPRLWYVVLLLLMPAMTVATYGVMRVMRLPLPPDPHVPILTGLALLPVTVIAALAEEVGWSGYATDPLQARWGTLGTGLALGVVWAVWHIIPLLQVHRGPAWIAGWWLGTVANRVLIVWLYNTTGKSVFAAALYHAMLNVCWQLFPNRGSHYDSRVSGVVIALVATIVTVVWGQRGSRPSPSSMASARPRRARARNPRPQRTESSR